VRRMAEPWSPSVHRLLVHLRGTGFDGAPQSLGVDDLGRDVVSYLPGKTVGSRSPWPAWTHSDEALVQVAGWLRRALEELDGSSFKHAVDRARSRGDAGSSSSLGMRLLRARTQAAALVPKPFHHMAGDQATRPAHRHDRAHTACR